MSFFVGQVVGPFAGTFVGSVVFLVSRVLCLVLLWRSDGNGGIVGHQFGLLGRPVVVVLAGTVGFRCDRVALTRGVLALLHFAVLRIVGAPEAFAVTVNRAPEVFFVNRATITVLGLHELSGGFSFTRCDLLPCRDFRIINGATLVWVVLATATSSCIPFEFSDLSVEGEDLGVSFVTSPLAFSDKAIVFSGGSFHERGDVHDSAIVQVVGDVVGELLEFGV